MIDDISGFGRSLPSPYCIKLAIKKYPILLFLSFYFFFENVSSTDWCFYSLSVIRFTDLQSEKGCKRNEANYFHTRVANVFLYVFVHIVFYEYVMIPFRRKTNFSSLKGLFRICNYTYIFNFEK